MGKQRGFLITSEMSWSWIVSDDGGVRETETCGGLESVGGVTETYEKMSCVSMTQLRPVKHDSHHITFFSCGAGCVATWVAGEVTCEAGTAYGEGGARWEWAQPWLWSPDRQSDLPRTFTRITRYLYLNQLPFHTSATIMSISSPPSMCLSAFSASSGVSYSTYA